jgi:hypothetical protein
LKNNDELVSNSHSQETIFPSKSEERSVKLMTAGAKILLLISTLNKAIGGLFAGGETIVISVEDVAVLISVPSDKPSSLTVNLTVYVPGKKYV